MWKETTDDFSSTSPRHATRAEGEEGLDPHAHRHDPAHERNCDAKPFCGLVADLAIERKRDDEAADGWC